MILLTSADTITVVVSKNFEGSAAAVDNDNGTITPQRFVVTMTTSTPQEFTLVPAPSVDMIRNVKTMTIYNADTVDATAEIRIKNGSNVYRLAKIMVPTGKTLLYSTETGFVITETIGSSGTVTSVGLSLPISVFSISGSPVTTSGTLTGSFVDQLANTVFAGPATGAAAPPTFRTLVSDDLIESGVLFSANNLSDLTNKAEARGPSGLNIDQAASKSFNTDFTIAATDRTIISSTTAMTANHTATLPAASAVNAGQQIDILDLSGVTGTHTLTITRAGTDTINGTTSVALAEQYAGWRLKSDGISKWTAQYLPPAKPSAGTGGAAIGANLLLNGGFAIDQRNEGASVAVSDDIYCLDRWYVLTQTASITVAQQTDQENGTPYNIRLTQSQASAQRMGLAQIVEARDCKHLRGGSATLKARVRCSASQAIRYAVLGWTGTADVVTSDVVNDWTSADYTAGGFFLGANLSVIAVGATTPAAGAWTDLAAITGTVGASVNNIIVFIWTEGTAAQNFTLDIARAKLEAGASATEFTARPYAEELALCQRYCEVLGSTTGVEVYGVGQCASTNRAISFYAFKTVKRAPPALTLSAVTDWAYYNQTITQFVVWSSISSQLSPFGAMFDVTTATSDLGGAGQATMFGPNNTANARMTFDAEL